MSGSNTVFLAAGIFGLAASGVLYIWAKGIERRRKRRGSSQP